MRRELVVDGTVTARWAFLLGAAVPYLAIRFGGEIAHFLASATYDEYVSRTLDARAPWDWRFFGSRFAEMLAIAFLARGLARRSHIVWAALGYGLSFIALGALSTLNHGGVAYFDLATVSGVALGLVVFGAVAALPRKRLESD